MKRLLSKTAFALVLAGGISTSAVAQTKLNELSDELEIMSNILKTALKQDLGNTSLRFREIESTYLKNQGVVFRVSTSGLSGGFNFIFSTDSNVEFLSAPPAPAVPDVHQIDKWVVELEGEDFESIAEDAMEQAREAMEEAREKMRELRHQEREYAWESREYERRKRDIEFEMRTADEKRKKELMKESKDLEASLAKLQSKQKEVEKYALELEQERKKQAELRAAEKQQQYKAFLSRFESNISTTLCKYGSGLKALPKNENVSFVLPRFDTQERGQKQDRIYVFAVNDINDCVRDKITSEQLMSKSSAYLF